ncbi:predicted protein [Nematostella vectensis]|uniref:G-protein coupled receptors family 1 profile domain-containing protein n=1 Tax=Nematostella vectensis TaxID=45351 RepID=A7S192_NEMVE|nr:predicted protein [Nematostella vectensis]|eukprot:XP_001634657.1 predicted protein [Nematostella vectensis]
MAVNSSNVPLCWGVDFSSLAANKSFLIFICVLNNSAAMSSVFGNLTVIVSIWRTPSIHSPSFVLISIRCVLDMSIGLFMQGLCSPVLLLLYVDNLQGFCSAAGPWLQMGLFINGAILFMVMLTAMDIFSAIKLKLRYRQLVTTRRMIIAVVLMVLLSAALSALSVTLPLVEHFLVMTVVVGIALNMTFFFYGLSYNELRRHQRTVQPCQQTTTSIAKYRKTFTTLVLILGFLLLCYLPADLTFLVVAIYGFTEASIQAVADVFSLQDWETRCIRMFTTLGP